MFDTNIFHLRATMVYFHDQRAWIWESEYEICECVERFMKDRQDAFVDVSGHVSADV